MGGLFNLFNNKNIYLIYLLLNKIIYLIINKRIIIRWLSTPLSGANLLNGNTRQNKQLFSGTLFRGGRLRTNPLNGNTKIIKSISHYLIVKISIYKHKIDKTPQITMTLWVI